ncbi:MAG: CynX/NimT family MFS transporter [Steroidobacteraceae bacterium]
MNTSITARNEASILGAVFLIALNLRPAMASLGPVLETLRTDLKLSHGAAGLLTTLPVLCMGLFAPLVLLLSERLGLKRAVLFSTLLIGGATLLRGHGSFASLWLSALGAGAGIAVLNPLLSMYVKQTFSSRSARVSSWTTSALCLGAAVSAGSSAILARYFGWPQALACWSMLAFTAAALWWRTIPDTLPLPVHRAGRTLPWRQPRAWLLVLVFGLHGMVFYVLLAWLAPAYVEYGMSPADAGHLLGLFALMQVTGTLLVSALPHLQRERRPALLLSGGATLAGLIGLWLVPLFVPQLWMCLLGAGTAGLFALTLILPLDYTESPTAAGAWTAMMCGGGYVIAAAGPVLAGWVRDHSDSYHSVFMLLTVTSAVVFGCCTLLTPVTRSEPAHAL